jgi:hypothetical protein
MDWKFIVFWCVYKWFDLETPITYKKKDFEIIIKLI